MEPGWDALEVTVREQCDVKLILPEKTALCISKCGCSAAMTRISKKTACFRRVFEYPKTILVTGDGLKAPLPEN